MAAVNKVREELAQAFLAALKESSSRGGPAGRRGVLQRRYRQTL